MPALDSIARRARTWATASRASPEREALGIAQCSVDYAVGLAVVALVPSLFWTGLVKIVAVLIGWPVGWPGLLAFGGSIFVFLAMIYALVARRR